MTIKLTPASFLSGVRQSGLIDSQRVDSLIAEMEQAGVDQSSATALAAGLVKRGALSEWQSEKLLQGRHKGFILGRYKLLSLLGAGEMSAVYLAEHVMLERRCAIKVLPGNKVKDTSYLGRFHREAKAVARLDHVNIVRAYDVDQQFDGGTEIHFLVMEYVHGKNIAKVIAEQGPLDFITATEYIRQAAEGLSHAHQAGMVHRDIKPDNLLIDKDGVVKILDLGLARLFQSAEEESLTIKHDEKVLGTADYLAPEQAIDSHKVDARADIYSLGCTFYFALTGHPPFTEGTLVQRLFAHQTKTPNPVRNERPDIPQELVAILEKMMAKKASQRFQTAMDLAQTLTVWLVEHAGQEWRKSHVVQVAQIKGMEGFDVRPAQPASSTLATPTVTLMPTPTPLARANGNRHRVRESATPKVEFYSTPPSLAAVHGTAVNGAIVNDATAAKSAKIPVSSRSRKEAALETATDAPNLPAREQLEQGVSQNGLRTRAKVNGRTGNANHQGTEPASSRNRVGTQITERPVAQAVRATRTGAEQVSSNGILAWLYSNDSTHVKTRQLVGWVTLSAVTLTCCSMLIYWIVLGSGSPEQEVTQPRQDAVIDGFPGTPTV